MNHYFATIRLRLSEKSFGEAMTTARSLADKINDFCVTDCAEVIGCDREEELDSPPASEVVEVLALPACEVPKCTQTAGYEGWARKADPCTGTASGMVRMLKVCESHKLALIGFQE